MSSDNTVKDLRIIEKAPVYRVDWQQVMGEGIEGFTWSETVDRDDVAEELGVDDELLRAAGVPKELAAINGYVDLFEWEDEISEQGYYGDLQVQMDGCEGPMMNFVYSLEKEVSLDDVTKISANVCMVCFSEDAQDAGLPEYGFALTGGGMDMSWDIAGAYVDLGFLPPTTVVSRLPEFAGDTLTERKARIIEAMRQDYRVRARWIEQGIRDLNILEAKLKSDG